LDHAEAEDKGDRMDMKGTGKRRHSIVSRARLVTSMAMLLLVGLEMVEAKQKTTVSGVLSKVAKYCLGPRPYDYSTPKRECFRLMPTPFQESDVAGETPVITIDSSIDLGRVCLDVIETEDGDVELEVNYEVGEGWTMKDGHFYLGTSTTTAPFMLHYTRDGKVAKEVDIVAHKLPDATRFPYHTTLKNAAHTQMKTTSIWNEEVEVNENVVCSSSVDATPDETGIRVFSAQAVLWNQENDLEVTSFATLKPQENFATLEDYFIVCTCPDTTLEDADIEGEQEEETEEHVLAKALEELANQLEHSSEGDTNDNSSDPSPDPQNVDQVQEGHLDRHSNSDSVDKEDDPVVVMVQAEELELTTSFLVVVPDQKHYMDLLLDEAVQHKTEHQIEASLELHETWHAFVAQLMSDFHIPAVNASQGINNRRGRRRRLKAVTVEWMEDSPDLFKFLITTPCPVHVLDQRRIDMGRSSPKDDLVQDGSSFKTTCYKAFGKYRVLYLHTSDYQDPTNLDHKDHDDDIQEKLSSLPVDSTQVRGGQQQQQQQQHIQQEQQQHKQLEQQEQQQQQQQQQVCEDIFHWTRQELEMHALGQQQQQRQDLSHDAPPFIIYGGQPESCLPTGYSTTMAVVKTNATDDDIDDSQQFQMLLGNQTSHNHHNNHFQKEALYQLHQEDGTWNFVRVVELGAYLVTSLCMMGFLIFIYCSFLPKNALESRNRVTDDWSHPSLRPRRIGSRSSSKQSQWKDPEFFPWLE
jgi:hypothetical protein